MSDAVERSEELDRRIEHVLVPRRMWLVEALFFVLILLVSVGFTLSFLALRAIGDDTRATVKDEIPSLKRQITEKDKAIADQQYVIDQAVKAIVAEADQIKSLGGSPPRVVLRPPETPTTIAR